MTTFLAFVFVLGVLVFVHELGHFLAAKRVGIQVLKFQLGFNPTILSFRRGDTEYGIGALPLGGYVKMAGENPEDGADRPRRRVPVEDQVGALPGAHHGAGDEPAPGRRADWRSCSIRAPRCRSTRISRRSSASVTAGFARRARPTSAAAIASSAVAGRRVDTWEQFFIAVGTRPNREVTIDLIRAAATSSTRQVTPRHAAPTAGSRSATSACCRTCIRTSAAVNAGRCRPTEAGLKAGRRHPRRRRRADHASRRSCGTRSPSIPNSRSRSSILRDGAPQTLAVTPGKKRRRTAGSASASPTTRQEHQARRRSQAARHERRRRTSRCAGLIFQTVWGLITRETSPKQLMGPVAIAQLSGESAQLGLDCAVQPDGDRSA